MEKREREVSIPRALAVTCTPIGPDSESPTDNKNLFPAGERKRKGKDGENKRGFETRGAVGRGRRGDS